MCRCPMGHHGYCADCQQGYALLVDEVCDCCARLGKKQPDPQSIAARLERGEPCATCGEWTHAPSCMSPKWECYGCKPRRR